MGTMYQVNQTTGEPSTPVLGGAASGGLTAEEHEWLESLANYTPNMYDINPTKTQGQPGAIRIGGVGSSTSYSNIPCCGYDKVSLMTTQTSSSRIPKYTFQYADGSVDDYENVPTTWSNWITIPQNAVLIKFSEIGPSSDTAYLSWVYFSLLTKDSPYNPDNQTP